MIVCTAFCEICAASSPATLKRLRRFVCGKGVLLLRFGRRMTVIGELTTAKRLAHEAVQADSEGDRPEDALRLYSRCTRIISEVVGRGDLGLSEANVEELRRTLRQYTERSEQLKLRLVREGKAFGLLDGLLVDCRGNTIALPGAADSVTGGLRQGEEQNGEPSKTLSFTVIPAYELESLKSPPYRCHEQGMNVGCSPEDDPSLLPPPPTTTATTLHTEHMPRSAQPGYASQSNVLAQEGVTYDCPPHTPAHTLAAAPPTRLRCGQCGGWIGNGEYCVAPRPFGGAPVALHRTCFYLFAAGLARERRNRFTFGSGEVVARMAISQRAVQCGALLTVRVEVENASHARITAVTLWMETREKRAHRRAWSHRTAAVRTHLAGKLPSKESHIEYRNVLHSTLHTYCSPDHNFVILVIHTTHDQCLAKRTN